MNGLRLMAAPTIRLVVATINTRLRATPSSRKFHAKIARAANAHSTIIPPAPMAARWRREVNFHASEVSEYSIGTITIMTMPMVGTRQP